MQGAGQIILTQRRQKEFAESKSVTLQPYVLIVGESRFAIEEVYLCIDNDTYLMPDLLTAIDICFKTFQVFNAQYPAQGEHLWLLIQKGLYKLETQWDPKISLISQILNDIKNLQ